MNGNLAIPIFCRKGYDGSLVGRAIKARLSLENLMTPMWKNGLGLAEIVRRQFGRQYDGSEARNNITTMLQQNSAQQHQREPRDLFDDEEQF